MALVENEIIRPNGTKGNYSYLKLRPTVGIVPIHKNKVCPCRQFRYIFNDETWEIPRGFAENNESFEEAAKRELNEKAGVTAAKLTLIGSLRLSAGTIDEQCSVFLAQDLLPVNNFKVQTEEIEKVKTFLMNEVVKMIKEGTILDGLTIASILLAKEYLFSTPGVE